MRSMLTNRFRTLRRRLEKSGRYQSRKRNAKSEKRSSEISHDERKKKRVCSDNISSQEDKQRDKTLSGDRDYLFDFFDFSSDDEIASRNQSVLIILLCLSAKQ